MCSYHLQHCYSGMKADVLTGFPVSERIMALECDGMVTAALSNCRGTRVLDVVLECNVKGQDI